jgi:uncharacterized protein YjbI with pentapeptide repeats
MGLASMANDEHVAILKKGVDTWNMWRDENPSIRPDLSNADLSEVNLRTANLSRADLCEADLSGADLFQADLTEARCIRTHLNRADLICANLSRADFTWADLTAADLTDARLIQTDLRDAYLSRTDFSDADLSGADLRGAVLESANLNVTDLSGADLRGAYLVRANFDGANLSQADLSGADLSRADLRDADLRGADLCGANLRCAVLVETDLTDADLTNCRIYGVSAWELKLEKAKQQNLVITDEDEPTITVDNIEVAQFVYLLLHNEKIRHVIDTVGKKGVLLLGRFTEGRVVVLERLREKLRSLGFVPMVFNFDKPETKDFTETVRLLANLSHFVIVDITNPRSAPLELQATVPDYMVPFAPILQQGEQPFAMFVDLQNKYDWVLKPVIAYPSVDRLIEVLEDKIVRPAEAKFNQLLARRTGQLRVENV